MTDAKWWNRGWVASARKRPPRLTRSDILTVIVVLSSLLIAGRGTPRESTADTDFPFPVAMRVIDSTTVDVAIPGVGIEQVRMIGIDPVGPVLPGQDSGCLVDEAKRFIQTRMPAGSPLVLVADPTQTDRDTDRRLLRHVIIDTDPNAPIVPDAVPDPMVRAPMSLAYLLVSGGYARVRALPNPSIFTPQLRVAEDNARAEGAGVWSPGGCGSSLAADGITVNPDGQAAIDPQVLLPITVPELELPPAVRAILGDSPAIGAALAPGRAAVATTIAAANSSMATTFAVLTAIPTIAATRGEPGQAEPLTTVTPPPLPLPTPDPPEE
ncbi:MAG: hypothetical protein RL022_884 [Chloroflexota bacterium]